MNFSALFNLWKKRIRRKRVRVAIGLCAAFILIITVCVYASITGHSISSLPVFAPSESTAHDEANAVFLKEIQEEQQPVETQKRTLYVCGEETEVWGKMDPGAIYEKVKQHPQWIAELSADHKVIIVESKEDLSPSCKRNSYFGLDKNGNLSLFEGEPAKEKVIRTFFQMNIRRLESSLPGETVKQLEKGIKISDYDEYNSVLSTFSEFAIEQTEPVDQSKTTEPAAQNALKPSL